jgi:DNA-binding LytR/AlgR family response regulator
MTLRALIADDEEAPREQMRAALKRVWPQLQIVDAAHNGVDAWDGFQEHEPQVCFLDIRMPGLSGLDVASRIATSGIGAQIVFVTAFDDHAVQAFNAGAVDYVMKPVEDARLAQTVERIKPRLQAANPQPAPELQALIAQLGVQAARSASPRFIQATVGREIKLIAPEEIVYFEADSRYTRVVYAGGEALIRTPLKELLATLDTAQFWQIHRSVIVNNAHVASAVRVDESNMHVTLKGRVDKLPVSRHFQSLFRGQ